MTLKAWTTRSICALAVVFAPQILVADTALIAVATNFSEVMDTLKSGFEATNDHKLTVVTGSTGKLYAQIVNGAPFDVLLAADQARPERLVTDGLASDRFTFATGQLVLWSIDPERISEDGFGSLTQNYRRLAIANPALAPYGAAALEALTSLGLNDRLQERIVMGENIGQTHALVASGNAELGIVALAYVASPRNKGRGSFWRIPSDLHSPIHQDAVLMTSAQNNLAATDFLRYLHSDAAKETIRNHGYEVK